MMTWVNLWHARASNALLLALGTIPIIFLISRPLEAPATGLDPSWRYAAEYAYLNGLVFGRDLSFTVGPLSFVYTHLFHPQTFPWIVISMAHALMVYLAAAWWSTNRGVAIACLAALALMFAPLATDALFFSLCLMVFLMAVGGRTPGFVVAALAAGLAIPSLAKFNVLVLATPLMLLADVTAIAAQSRCYGFSAIYLVALLICYVISGQPVDAFSDFISGAFDFAVGYGETMGNFWWTSQQTVIVAVVLGVLGTAWVLTRKATDQLHRISYLSGLALYLFLSFKTGNVRAGHQYTTWQALAAATIVFFMFPVVSPSEERTARMAGAAWALACFLLMDHFWPASWIPTESARADSIAAQTRSAIKWVNPTKQLQELQARRAAAIAQVADRAPPDLAGTVGSLPWDLSEIIAAGLPFVPQPSLQQYNSYTPRLRELDRQHFVGARRPDYLVFYLQALDGRYRTSELGPSLPHILAGYDLIDAESSVFGGAALLLRRRTTPRSIKVHKLDEKPAGLDEWVEVPPVRDGGLMLSIRFEERLAGKVLALLYKQSSFELELKFANGTVEKSRIFRNLVFDGFLVLPPKLDAVRLFLETGRSFNLAAENPLVAVRVSPSDLASVAFLPTYVLSATAVSVTGAAEHPRLPLSPLEDAMLILRRGRIIEASEVRMVDGRLLAHAPSRIAAKFPAGRDLSGEIGFFDGAWQTGKPRPVTFAISALTSSGVQPLFERMLDPLNRADDRGPQPFSIKLPPPSSDASRIELLFETRPETPWGWTYWSGLKMAPNDKN
jgi:hypothetical protein